MTSLHFPLQSAFVAIPLEDAAKREFLSLHNLLKPFERMLTFQNPASPHLTLHYWGTVMEIEYRQFLTQCERIAAVTEPFALKVEGIDTFGHRGDDHVLLLSVPFSEPLARLKKRCPWPSIDRSGREIPLKPFHPHITLARIKHAQRFAVEKKKILKLLDAPSFTMHVDRLRMYAEIGGKKQTALDDFIIQ